MSHERYTRTNQKLFYAGLALENWRAAEQGTAFDAPGRVQAAREEAVFHLCGALLGLCHEIAGYYRLTDDALPVVEPYLAPACLERNPGPELAELAELAGNPDTWLASLLEAHAALYRPPAAPAKAKQDPTLPLIEAISVDDEAAHRQSALTVAALQDWRQQIRSLALRFREGLSEI